MKKIVIAGSASLQDDISYWISYFEQKYEVLDYPKKISDSTFMEVYPNVYREFFISVTKTDVLFIMNVDKNGVSGYIGAETFAELTFALAQNLLYDKKIKIVLYQMPDFMVSCYNEIRLWLELKWICLYDENCFEVEM